MSGAGTIRRQKGTKKTSPQATSKPAGKTSSAAKAPPPVWYPFGSAHTWGVPNPAITTANKKKKRSKQVEQAAGVGMFADEKWERYAAPAIEATDVPQEFIDLASAAELTGLTIKSGDPGSYGDMKSFTGGDAATNSLGVLGLASSLPGMIGSGKDAFSGGSHVYQGYRGYDQGDGQGRVGNSIDKNLGAVQLEKGVTGLVTGGGGMGVGIASLAVGDLPIAGAVMNFVDAGLSTKSAIEDATASGKLGYQRRQARHDLDQQLPLKLREQRFSEFYANYSADKKAQGGANKAAQRTERRKAKRGSFARFEKVAGEYAAKTGKPDPAKLNDLSSFDTAHFLDYLRKNRIKDFGYGSELRKQQEKDYKAARDAGAVDPSLQGYADMRSLGKVALFGQRRKAETATLNSVGALGSTVSGVGNITAGADFGATLATGKLISGLKSGYETGKTAVKRGRRVHKLRTAKNEIGYGNKSSRGFLWGTRQFFLGDIEGQMGTARAAVSTQGKAGEAHKAASRVATMSDTEKQKVLRRLTKKCDRRINDLLRCLVTGNEEVYNRAKAVLHVIAETNLAGGLQKIKDTDLDRYRDLFWRAQNKDPKASPPGSADLNPLLAMDVLHKHQAEFTRRSDTLRTIISTQLQGVGG